MVLWPDWENLFIPLQSYSYMYIKTLLLFRDWNPDFCKIQGKERSAGKIVEFEKLRVQYSSGLREENCFQSELSGVLKYRRFEKAGFQFLNF